MPLKPPPSDFKPRMTRFAYLFAARGKTISEAARLAGISRRTAYVWLQDEDFRLYVDTIRDLVMEGHLNRLVGLIGRSIKAQSELLSSGDENVKLAASKAIQDVLFRFVSAIVTNRRLSKLELAQLEGKAREFLAGATEADGRAKARTREMLDLMLWGPEGEPGPAPSEGNGSG
jgi:hypothetical protein